MVDINSFIEKIDQLEESHVFLLGVVKRQRTKIFMYQILCGVLGLSLFGAVILLAFR